MNMGVYIPDEVRGGVRETESNSKVLDLVADVGWIRTYEVLLWALALLLAAVGLVAVFTTGAKTISVLGLTLVPAVFVLTMTYLGRLWIRSRLVALAFDLART